MLTNKPIFKFFIGLVIIVSIVTVYIFIKFDFYEERVTSKIREYNKAVEILNMKLDDLDSIKSLKYSKKNFYYLSVTKELPERFGTDYEGFLKWLEGRIEKMNQITMEISFLKKQSNETDSLQNELLKKQMDEMKLDTKKKNKKDYKYSPEDLNNIYEEADDEKNELYDKKFKK